ncbi:MAG: hypothetical protein ACR2GC_10090 [Methyloceanibacter sp.]|uniref:hypothetical protein n=1 Tax=Methyloceanibacter sp. TaxID=1965321 RepID=UPI003D9BCD49
MTKEERPKTILTDTGDVEFLPTDKGKRAAVVTWPLGAQPPRGRPAKHDWDSMLHWLVVKVDIEGGLPKGRGAQAVVEGWIQQEFINRNLDAPESLIRDHARRIYDEAAAATIKDE